MHTLKAVKLRREMFNLTGHIHPMHAVLRNNARSFDYGFAK